ncbi:Acetyltransferase (GNAT) family protein [Halovenus aranensis]|uniref:Acetyltransferase (GNAT) family protein n=1 Tax=Halovenus aranensis TaxID=890420 RepID=A0A1G8VPZ5_9EURY|nr:GNAT family N-acetyltransferase [Halovenus aranensis]SDJ67270.1 Acetyltransferase (GNAT) family protein [Halovenus aranensis]
MNIVELPAEEPPVRRFVEELWLPYNRELEATVDGFGLAEGVDLVSAEVPFRLDRVDTEGYRLWIAVDGSVDLVEGELAGFIAAEIDEAPTVFDRPDRLFICDIYVEESYRGTGLSETLFDRLREWAREAGCTQFSLDPHVDNDRAIAFYEKLGFETTQQYMLAEV